MAARYYVLVSWLDEQPLWEEAGLHLMAWGDVNDPGPSWCLLDDDNAPPDLNGKRVELTLTETGNGITVGRQVIS